MGETTRARNQRATRKSRGNDWLSRLDTQEKVVSFVAVTAFEKLILPFQMTGGCYYFAFFLRRFLKEEFGIQVDMVVGWVLTEISIPIPHAWIEFKGKKTDISMGAAKKPNGDFAAPVIIHDFVFRAGGFNLSYVKEISHADRTTHVEASNDPNFGPAYREYDETHRQILAWHASPTGTTDYFATAEDPDLKYENIALFLKNALLS
jgi:hypothetical protein